LRVVAPLGRDSDHHPSGIVTHSSLRCECLSMFSGGKIGSQLRVVAPLERTKF